MLPFIIGGAALAAAVGAGVAAYKRRHTKPTSDSPPRAPKSLGRFAVWGRPNAGKTTFIGQLRGSANNPQDKEATLSKSTYTSIPPFDVDGVSYRVAEITDMPGTRDRQDDWLELVRSHDHVFYLLNFSRKDDADYSAGVRADLRATIEALATSSKPSKKLHVIASHVDESYLKNEPRSEVNNKLQADPAIMRFYDGMTDVRGYVYAVNLTDRTSFEDLRQSIVRDLRV